MRRGPLAGLLAGAVLCAGCWPMRFNNTPGASGIVRDAQTRAPLAGAQVALSLSKFPPGSTNAALEVIRAPTVTTGAAGQFFVPAERRWGIYILPMDIFPEFGLLVVQHHGYNPALIPIWSHSVTNLGEVYLKAAGK